MAPALDACCLCGSPDHTVSTCPWRKGMMRAIALLLIPLAALASLPAPGTPGAPNDPRYAGEPARDKHGRILRNKAVLREFAKVFPCPANLKPVPSCPGWSIDHVIPLAAGGADRQDNLQWLPAGLKSCAGRLCKDRWERKYHAFPRQRITLKGTP
jgi:hypothetical protein